MAVSHPTSGDHFQTPVAKSSHVTNIAVGVSIGGAVLIAGVIVAFVLVRKRRGQQTDQEENVVPMNEVKKITGVEVLARIGGGNFGALTVKPQFCVENLLRFL